MYTVTIIPPGHGFEMCYKCKDKDAIIALFEERGHDVDFEEKVSVATRKCPVGLLFSTYWDTEGPDDVCALLIEGPDVIEWDELGDYF